MFLAFHLLSWKTVCFSLSGSADQMQRLLSLCFTKKTLHRLVHSEWFQNCPDILFLHFDFVTVISAMFLPFHYNSVRSSILILVFIVSIWTGFATDHTIRALYVFQFNPIEKEIEDKDLFLRFVYLKNLET